LHHKSYGGAPWKPRSPPIGLSVLAYGQHVRRQGAPISPSSPPTTRDPIMRAEPVIAMGPVDADQASSRLPSRVPARCDSVWDGVNSLGSGFSRVVHRLARRQVRHPSISSWIAVEERRARAVTCSACCRLSIGAGPSAGTHGFSENTGRAVRKLLRQRRSLSEKQCWWPGFLCRNMLRLYGDE